MSTGTFPYPTGENPYIGIDDENTNDEREKRRAEFSIECRKVRMWIAQNPGKTSYEIKAACGGRHDMCLAKMLNMKIIKVVREPRLPRGFTNRWYVVPAPDLTFDPAFMQSWASKEGHTSQW
jgi:hypothetical protein